MLTFSAVDFFLLLRRVRKPKMHAREPYHAHKFGSSSHRGTSTHMPNYIDSEEPSLGQKEAPSVLQEGAYCSAVDAATL